MIDLTFCYSYARNEPIPLIMMYSPLAIAYLAAHTPKNYNLSFYDEYVDEKLDAKNIKADLVAVSTGTFGVNRAYEIADQLKKRGIYSVIGGSHASALPNEAMEHFNTVVAGEGEIVWKQFLTDFENGRPLRLYDGSNDMPLEKVGIPDRRYVHPSYFYPSVQTSRGCPFSCSFCFLSIYKKRKYRVIPHDYVLQDLDRVKDHKIVVISDDNFIGCSEDDFTDRKILLEKIVRSKYKFYWGCQASVNMGKDTELMKLMYRAGCRTVFMGFETQQEEELKKVQKKQNFGVDYKYLIKQIHKHKIGVIASFIFGLDSHKPGCQKIISKELKEVKADFAVITLMNAFPGTPLFEQLEKENRVDRNWDNIINLNFPSIKFKNFTHEEIITAREEIMKSFYSVFNLSKILLRWIFRDWSLLPLFLKMVRRKRYVEKHRIEENKRMLKKN